MNVNITVFLLLLFFAQTFSKKCSCGVERGRKRVIGGTEVPEGRYPWMVYLYMRGPEKDEFCGGAIINDRYILTAAHCTDKAIDARFSYGSNYMGTADTLIDTDKIIQHEAFDHPSLHNDIALIRLSDPLQFSAHVRPICLPTVDIDQRGKLTLAGWGKTESGHNAHTLMETSFTETDWDACKKRHHSHLLHSQFCAGAIGKDSCFGDSGGPLIKKVDGKNYAVGIVSSGISPCGSNQYSIYTKVSSYLDWILEKTSDAEYCF